MALITLERAAELVPNFQYQANDGVLNDCINAASEVIERYCDRTFALTNYDELTEGTGAKNLLLCNYPVTQISRVAYNQANVVQVQMTTQTTQRANWRIDGTNDSPPKPGNLYLDSVSNGVETLIVIGPLTSASPTVTINGGSPTPIAQMLTFNDLANAITTYGSAYGWKATGLGIYTTWAIADLRPPLGAFESRWFGVSYLTMHAWNLPYFEQRPSIGEIVAPQGFTFGYNNYRIIYQAGYAVIPNPIQQACAALAVSVYNSIGLNANLTSENLGGYSYSNIAEKNFHSLDIVSRFGLPLWKNHRAARFKITV